MLPNCDNSTAPGVVKIDGTDSSAPLVRDGSVLIEKSSASIESERPPYLQFWPVQRGHAGTCLARAKCDTGTSALTAAPVDLDVQIANLLPQCVAVEPEQIGSADLIAPGGRQRRREQGYLDLPEDPVIEARRWHTVRETREMR